MLPSPLNKYSKSDYYTFENFISYSTNVDEKNTAIEFCRNSNLKDNILVISGKVGCGKTHLALAVLNEIESQNFDSTPFMIGWERLYSLLINNKWSQIFSLKFLNSQSIILIDSYFDSKQAEKDFNTAKNENYYHLC